MEGEGQKPETRSDYGYYEHGVMTHGMLSRWDNYGNYEWSWWVMHSRWVLHHGDHPKHSKGGWRGDQCFWSLGGLGFYCNVTSLELPPHGTVG